jgi:precorrin-6B methylase 2
MAVWQHGSGSGSMALAVAAWHWQWHSDSCQVTEKQGMNETNRIKFKQLNNIHLLSLGFAIF